MPNATEIAKLATSSKLNGPDWALNIELCDILNSQPWQRKDGLKIIKKKLLNRNHKKQLLALFVLETLSKNCGEFIFLEIVELGILNEMVKLAKNKPDLNVREKILSLIDAWQEALGGSLGSFHLYYDAYIELKSFGLEFFPREEDNVPLVTPPKAHPMIVSSSEEVTVQNFPESDSSELSMDELEYASGVADVLFEILAALDPNNPKNVRDEMIFELVEQCRLYQKRVTDLVNNTLDEGLLCKGLELNDTLQRVLVNHDDISTGKNMVMVSDGETSAPSLVNVDQKDKESEGQEHDQSRMHLSQEPVVLIENNSTDSGSNNDLIDESPAHPIRSSYLNLNSSLDSLKFTDELFLASGKESKCKEISNSKLNSGSTFAKYSDLDSNSKLTKSTTIDEEEQREEALFKDLVEFAKAMKLSSKPRREFQSIFKE